MIHELRQSPRAKGSAGVCVPGELEWKRREEALANGMALPADVMANLRLTASECNVTEPNWMKKD